MFVLINDQLVPEDKASLLVSDLAIQRGDGIFDFCKTIDDRPVFLDDHLKRFVHSAQQLRLDPGKTTDEIKTLIQTLQQHNNIPNAGIRLTLTGGYSANGYTLAKPNLIITQRPLDLNIAASFQTGIRLVSYPHQRQMPDVKTIDYLMAIWLQPFIKGKGADDVLYHQQGSITECPRSNFFIVTKDDKIVTPSENILKGIIRMKTLQLANTKYTVEERPVSLQEAYTAKEAFITSTTKHILPVLQIDGHRIGNGNPGKSSQWLLDQLDQLVAS